MKKFQILFTLFLFGFLIFPACQSSKVDIQAEIDTVRKLENKWTTSLQTKDIDQIIALTSSDCILMRPNAIVVSGHQAIRDRYDSHFKDTTLLFETYAGTIDNIEVAASGDFAYARGHDVISKKTKTGIVQEQGKWVDVWKRVNGEWKTVISIFNSNEPLVVE
jgi:ketosteroid isomerase-like protein